MLKLKHLDGALRQEQRQEQERNRIDPVRRPVERVTDADIARAFDGTNFGRTDHKHLLALSVLKKALNYHCGHTVTQIMVQMGLTTEKGRVTEKGRLFCYEALDAGRWPQRLTPNA